MTTIDPSVIMGSSNGSVSIRSWHIWAENPVGQRVIQLSSGSVTGPQIRDVVHTTTVSPTLTGDVLCLDGCANMLLDSHTFESDYGVDLDMNYYLVEPSRLDIIQDMLDSMGLTTDLPDGSTFNLGCYTGRDDFMMVDGYVTMTCSVSAGGITVTSVPFTQRFYMTDYSTMTCYLHLADVTLLSLGDGGGEPDLLIVPMMEAVA